MCSNYVFVVFCQLDCPAALERIKEGRPITIKDDKGNTSKAIADTVSVSEFCKNSSFFFLPKELKEYSVAIIVFSHY